MRKLAVLFALLSLLAILFTGCGGGSTETRPTEPGAAGQEGTAEEGEAAEGRTFTLKELAEFDGKEGRPAFVAVDGVVYDVTGSSQWPEGDHSPCNLDAAAGKDLSDILDQAPPRMRNLIENMPVVGRLVSE